MLCALISPVSECDLPSMEERRALFATSIFSRVEDTADDNLERSSWLVSVPDLLTDNTTVTYQLQLKRKRRDFHYQV